MGWYPMPRCASVIYFEQRALVPPVALELDVDLGVLPLDRLVIELGEFVEVRHRLPVDRADDVAAIDLRLGGRITRAQGRDPHALVVVELLVVGESAGYIPHGKAPGLELLLLAQRTLELLGLGGQLQRLLAALELQRQLGSDGLIGDVLADRR